MTSALSIIGHTLSNLSVGRIIGGLGSKRDNVCRVPGTPRVLRREEVI